MAVKPSLALIPSGVKANKVYSVLPSDGVGDFDFSRSGSATRINKDGLIETVGSNIPRLNYPMIDGVVSGCPSLLLEPARTNLVQYSEDFTSWINSSSYITSDYGISPDGLQNASRLLFTGTNQTLSKNIGTNGTLSYSIYVKGVKGETINISMASGSDESFLLNGEWQRLSYSDTVSNSTININTFGNKTARDLLIWGAQLEQGSYPTSYIPTNGEVNGVTRSAETCNGAGDVNTFNDSEGVLMAEISAFQEIPTTNEHIVLRNSASTDFSNSILIQHRNDGNLRIYIDGFSSGNIQFIVDDINWLENNKIAIQYDSISSNYKLFLNGITKERYSSAANQSVVGLNDISFYWGSVNNPFYGNTKQIQYFDTALTDTDLEELTSWVSFTDMANSQLYSIQ